MHGLLYLAVSYHYGSRFHCSNMVRITLRNVGLNPQTEGTVHDKSLLFQ